MNSPNTPPDFSDSDQRWLDALMTPHELEANLNAEGDASAKVAVQEAALLREALTQEQARIEHSPALKAMLEPANTEAKLQALLAALHSQGLLDAKAAQPAPQSYNWRWWRWGAPLGLAMAAVLVGVVLRPLLMPPPAATYSEAPVWRGGQPALVRKVNAPLTEAQAVQARLKEVGVWSAIYQQGPDYVLDVDVDAAQLESVEPALKAEGLPLQPGLVRIRFVKG